MELFISIVALIGALTIGAMSPGPSFVLVARTAISNSRADGLAAAVGMGIGGVIFSVLVLLGLQAVLAGVPWLYLLLRFAGGAYLIYLGLSIWCTATEPLVTAEFHRATPNSLGRSFLIALGAQLSNPKTAVVYGSIFAALLPQELPISVALALPAIVFVVEAGWYAVVAFALSSESPRAAYLRTKAAVDRLAGGVLCFLGLKLVASSSTSS